MAPASDTGGRDSTRDGAGSQEQAGRMATRSSSSRHGCRNFAACCGPTKCLVSN